MDQCRQAATENTTTCEDLHFELPGRLSRAYCSENVIKCPHGLARAFVRDMKAFFAVKNQIKADEIAIHQLVALNEYLGRREKPLRVSDVKEMFLQMRASGSF